MKQITTTESWTYKTPDGNMETCVETCRDDDNRTEYHEIYGCEPGRTPGWRLSAVLEMTVRVERD